MSLFSRLFGRKPATPEAVQVPLAPPAPDGLVYVVGDIHGRIDLLDRLLNHIADHRGDRSATIVTVGDYVDRGEGSDQVLARLSVLERASGGTMVCLMGNHEKMMLDFLSDPEERGGRWVRNGGLQTLASFGVGRVTETSSPEDLARARDDLAKTLPAHLAKWLSQRPLKWQSGNLAVVHAAADPDLDMAEQSDRCLLWGHEKFLSKPRHDGLWIAHGHTIFDTPHVAQSRISVDTGAYYSGQLTAAAIAPNGDVEFLQT